MKELAQYTLASAANSVTISGLDTAHEYENIIVFYRARCSNSSVTSLYVAPNYDGVKTWGSGTTVALTTGSDMGLQNYGINQGVEAAYCIPGTQELGFGFGFIQLSSRGSSERPNMVIRFGIAGAYYNAVYGVANGVSAMVPNSTNGSLLTSLRFSLPSVNFTTFQASIYGA